MKKILKILNDHVDADDELYDLSSAELDFITTEFNTQMNIRKNKKKASTELARGSMKRVLLNESQLLGTLIPNELANDRNEITQPLIITKDEDKEMQEAVDLNTQKQTAIENKEIPESIQRKDKDIQIVLVAKGEYMLRFTKDKDMQVSVETKDQANYQ